MNWKLFLIFPLLLSSCTTTVTKPIPVREQINCNFISMPSPLSLYKDISPINKGDGWFFSHSDYLKLRDNFIEIKRYLKEVRIVIRAYKSCIDNYNKEAKPLASVLHKK